MIFDINSDIGHLLCYKLHHYAAKYYTQLLCIFDKYQTINVTSDSIGSFSTIFYAVIIRINQQICRFLTFSATYTIVTKR